MKKLSAQEEPATSNRPLVSQEWRNILFLHWECPIDVIRPTVPKELTIDTFHGAAYVTIAAFCIDNYRLLNWVPLPKRQPLIGLNVRTYVRDKNETQGMWFYSLEINSALASFLGSKLFHLPYREKSLRARLNSAVDIEYSTLHVKRADEFFYFSAEIKKEVPYVAPITTLEHFLIERYVQFTSWKSQFYVSYLRHTPYPLYKAQITKCEHPVFNAPLLSGLRKQPNHLSFSSGVDVDITRIKPVI